MNNTKSGLSKNIRYFYGIGDMCYALMTSVYTYYLTYYYTNVAMLGLGTIAMLTTVSSIFDSSTSWVYGAVINSTKPMKWGRYRSWLICLTWLLPVTSFMLYCRVGKSEATATIFFFIAMIISRIVQNFPYTANVAMINVVGKTADDRITMASSRATWNNASKFAWSYVGVPFLAFLTGIVTEQYAYATLASLLGIGTFFGYYAHFKMTEGYEDTGAAEIANAAKTKRAKLNPVDMVKALVTNPPLLALIIADLAKWLFNFMVAGSVVYYFAYIALNKGLQKEYTLVIAFAAVFGAYGSRYIGKKLSGRKTMIFFYLIMAACLLVARTAYTNVWLVIGLVSLSQLCYGCVYSCSSAYIVVPESVLLNVPDNISDIEASMVEPFAVGLHAVNQAGGAALKDKSIVIYGAGPIGLFALEAAKYYGVKQIIMLDMVSSRLELAKEHGATHVILGNDTPQALIAKVKELTGGVGADAVIDAVCLGITVSNGMHFLRPHGILSIVGLAKPNFDIDVSYVVCNEITIRGSYTYNGEMKDCIDILASGKVDTSYIANPVLPLSQGVEAFKKLAEKPEECIKVVFVPEQ